MTWTWCSASRSESPCWCRDAYSSRAHRTRSPLTKGFATSISVRVMADLLTLSGVRAGYGETVSLEDVTLSLPEQGTLAVLGRNGVGKTTLLATIVGHTALRGGSIGFAGATLETLP